MSNCKYLRIKSKKYKRYIYCQKDKKEITFDICKKCNHKEYKKTKEIKNKSSKLAKAERNRNSILQADSKHCFVCGATGKLDKDEVFGGSNRRTSIKWNLIYYLCRKCHSRKEVDKELRQKLHDNAREVFIEKYGEELFLKEFKKMYIK